MLTTGDTVMKWLGTVQGFEDEVVRIVKSDFEQKGYITAQCYILDGKKDIHVLSLNATFQEFPVEVIHKSLKKICAGINAIAIAVALELRKDSGGDSTDWVEIIAETTLSSVTHYFKVVQKEENNHLEKVETPVGNPDSPLKNILMKSKLLN